MQTIINNATKIWRAAAVGLGLAFVLFAGTAANAQLSNSTSYPQNTTLNISGPSINLTILAGSESDSLTVTSTNFTVSVLAGGTFTVRYPGPNPGTFPNNQSLAICNFTGGNNDLAIVGPKTVTVTPSTTVCSGTAGGSAGGAISYPSVSLVQPNGGETLTGGATYQIVYSSGGAIAGVNISLSTDNGATFPTVLLSNGTNAGSYSWAVPALNTTMAKIKVDVLDGTGNVAATVTSGQSFSIQTAGGGGGGGGGTPLVISHPSGTPTGTDSTATGNYDPTTAMANNLTIDNDSGFIAPPNVTPPCTAGSLLKLADDNNAATQVDTAVYYCGQDGKRHAFPSVAVFRSWFNDFSNVVILSADQMAAIPLGDNVTYRPGRRMIKIVSDPKVYAVAGGEVLRWVSTEAVAAALYGADWNTKIDDVDATFFTNYMVGAPITIADVTAGYQP